ncbi:protein DpdJ [Actinosynnema sp. NPDC002837]
MDDKLLEALTTIELKEAELLSWGAVGAEWTEAEILSLLAEHGDPLLLLSQLLDRALVVQTPTEGYRSRSAETIRLLATLRQSFRYQSVTEGRPLVLDYRFLHRPRKHPRRDVRSQAVLDDIKNFVGDTGILAAQRIIPPTVSGFQRRTTKAVLSALATRRRSSGVMVTAGTGSGKTLAFYLPVLTWLVGSRRSGSFGTRALALYPRNELLKDQLRALLEYVLKLNGSGGPALSLATWFGSTPESAWTVRKGWADGWRQQGDDFVCPYLVCLSCGSDLLWRGTDLEDDHEVLVCGSRSCDWRVEGSVLRLTRRKARTNPADLMLTTTESLNRQLAAPSKLKAFGIRPATLDAVLLDEVHTYEGTAGAHSAILLRRLKHVLRRSVVWVGLSATLRSAGQFFAQLVDLPPTSVTVVRPDARELDGTGAEYLVALHHNPHSETGTMSASIQAAMVLARSLDPMSGDPVEPPPDSEGVFGKRLFAFTDRLDSTNRLYWDLLDAEGWRWPNQRENRHRPLTLAHLRSQNQVRVAADRRQDAHDRDFDGQWWWLPELLGHGIGADRQLRLGRTSSQDRGVSSEAQVVVATATLEVGFDDDRVGAVLQHKAPHDAAQFLQRKGRAGRKQITRPWTVVVLSDWGRDRQAWDAYDALFDPVLPARNVPVENLYVLRIQAVYALLDWLAGELPYAASGSTWEDLSGPAASLYPLNAARQQEMRDRQDRMAVLLTKLLRPGPERDRLRDYLMAALGLGDGDFAASIVDTILWEPPRPLLPAVVATMRRRLVDQWHGEVPPDGATSLRTRTPLREFVPGNLFDDLLVPDVELLVPTRNGQREVNNLPALQTMQEFSPGNVSRHFGIWAANKRHWVPLPPPTPGSDEMRVDVEAVYRAEPIDIINGENGVIRLFSPRSVTLESVDPDVRDASSVRPEWEFHVASIGAGSPVELGRGAREVLRGLTAHLHIHGGGARVLRYARTARGVMKDPRTRRVRIRFVDGTGSSVDAALGVEVQCDALEGVVNLPETTAEPTPQERAHRLRHIVEAEAALPDDMSDFQRTSLVEVVLLVLAGCRFGDTAPFDGPDIGHNLTEAAGVLGLLGDDRDHAGAVADTVWPDWFAHPAVITAVRGAVREISAGERSPAWRSWWQRRYSLSAANLLLSALAAQCPGVDPDQLMIDLVPGREDTFWISEPSPGGTGQVETFVRALVQQPEDVGRALEDALNPSAAETMDQELSLLLRSESEAVRASLESFRTAWQDGHRAVEAAAEDLEAAAHADDIVLGTASRSALSTRLVGPGAHADLLDHVVSWLELRDQTTRLSGVQVSARTLGAMLAEEGELDEVLRLGDSVSVQRRARAVSNVLWPWGEDAHTALSYNPFSPRYAVSLADVRAHVSLTPTVIDVTHWDEACREAVHRALLTRAEVVLSARLSDRAILRSVVLEMQTVPVEVDTLLCYAVVVGSRTTMRTAEVRMLLREAL